MQFAPAQERDAAAIASIHNAAVERGDVSFDTVAYSATGVKRLLASLGERERLLVVRRAGEVLAWSIVKRYSPRWGYRFTCETSTYVRPDLLFQGIGSQLKRLVLEICEALGYHHVVAKIVSTNVASIRYNLKLGYEVVGIQRQVGKLDGDWLDVCVLQYLFDRA